MKAELITLAEFRRLTLLDAEAILGMLARGELKSSIGPASEVMIDISQLDPSILATRATTHPLGLSEAESDYIEEVLASELLSSMDGIIEESLALALRWQRESGDSSPENADGND